MLFSSVSENSRSGSLTRILVVIGVLVAFALGFFLRGGGDPSPGSGEHDHAAETVASVWTCSMHPQIKLPKAGKCPICFMDLIPLDTGEEEDLGPRAIVLTETAVALAEIQTVVVESRLLNSTLRLIGKVDFDETQYRVITARVPGRIDTLFVDYTGVKVGKGQRLASLYSPDLYASQWELLNAVQAEKELPVGADEFMKDSAAATVASAKERIRLWGLNEGQINGIIRRGKALDHLDINSPLGGFVVHKAAMEGMYVKPGTSLYTVADLSRVWVTLNAYESDLALLREGQTIDFTVEALPGREFTGDIVFIDPILDSRTRTVSVRVEVDNADGALKPGMFVTAVANAAAGNSATGSLVIPATAPMITGARAVVYVRLPDREKPTFEGREVVLGPRVGDHYLVESGLTAGERVVTKGNFKIDSALQIQAKPSMMNPEGGGPMPGHNHGGSSPSTGSGEVMEMDSEEEEPPLVVSEEFRTQLGEVLQSYLAMQKALAADDDLASKTSAEAAVQALARVEMGLLKDHAHMVWMKDEPLLKTKLGALATADGLKARRDVLRPASEFLWKTLNRFGYTQTEKVRFFHCPMAIDEAGANWIQLANVTANPYYGASMLRCGSQIDSLQVLSPAEGR